MGILRSHFLRLNPTLSFLLLSHLALTLTATKSKFSQNDCLIRNLNYPNEYLFNSQLDQNQKSVSNVYTKSLKSHSDQPLFSLFWQFESVANSTSNETYLLRSYPLEDSAYLCTNTKGTMVFSSTNNTGPECWWRLTPIYFVPFRTMARRPFENVYMISVVSSGKSLRTDASFLPFWASKRKRKVQLAPIKTTKKLADHFKWNIMCLNS
jgi:hypothetical protein